MQKTKIKLFKSYSDQDTTGRVKTEFGKTFFYNVICNDGGEDHPLPDISCS